LYPEFRAQKRPFFDVLHGKRSKKTHKKGSKKRTFCQKMHKNAHFWSKKPPFSQSVSPGLDPPTPPQPPKMADMTEETFRLFQKSRNTPFLLEMVKKGSKNEQKCAKCAKNAKNACFLLFFAVF
jgi:hypothetical protein